VEEALGLGTAVVRIKKEEEIPEKSVDDPYIARKG
jgi:hypothetical protein